MTATRRKAKGPPEGKPAEWHAEQRRLAAKAYRTRAVVKFVAGGVESVERWNIADQLELLTRNARLDPDSPASLCVELMNYGGTGLLEAAARLCELETFGSQSVLSLLGKLISDTTKRAILLDHLIRNSWSLKETAIALRLGSTSGVLRAISDLGLIKELEEARRAGLVTRAWNKKPLKDKKKKPLKGKDIG